MNFKLLGLAMISIIIITIIVIINHDGDKEEDFIYLTLASEMINETILV